jgi:hypothetical protein
MLFQSVVGVPSFDVPRLGFDVGLGFLESTLDADFRIWGAKFHETCLDSTQTTTNYY